MGNECKVPTVWEPEIAKECSSDYNVGPFKVTDPEYTGAGISITPVLKKYRISVFFDGTLNNRGNILARKANPEYYRKKRDDFFNLHGPGDIVNWSGPGRGWDSYFSDFSNVALLFDSLNTDTANTDFLKHEKLYIDGIGTRHLQEDEKVIGASLGMGINGVDTKVNDAFRSMGTVLYDFNTPVIDLLTVDVFGFSRGSAAARYFVWKLLEEHRNEPQKMRLRVILDANEDKIKKVKPQIKSIEVRFAGLFDTVASHGIDHGNDTEGLHLTAVGSAKKIVHLTAADEYRENFPLTDISRVSEARKVELSLPGAHSDIGGGYNPVEVEENIQVFDEDIINPLEQGAANRRVRNDRNWLINQGWYFPDEFEKKEDQWFAQEEGNFFNELKVTRRKILSDYHRIPLRIMMNYGKQEGLNFRLPKPLKVTATPLTGNTEKIKAWIEAFGQFSRGEEVRNYDALGSFTLLEDIRKELTTEQIAWCEQCALVGLDRYLGEFGRGKGITPQKQWKESEKPVWKNYLVENMIKLVRHRYFHFSARYFYFKTLTDLQDIGMSPRLIVVDDWTKVREREIIPG